MYMEYMAVMVILIPIRIIVKLDQEKRDIAINNSPMRLIDGGRARLARLAINHHDAINGNIICNPRAIIIVRL